MGKTDKEVLELCKAWFEDIMDRSDRLTSGNVAHGRAAIRGVAKNYAEFVDEHLQDRWKPSEEQMDALANACDGKMLYLDRINSLYQDLKKLSEE